MVAEFELYRKELEVSFENLPKFASTMEVFPYKSIIGQKRAEQSIDIGLEIDKKGYNIFISGHSGTGKTSYIKRKIEEYAKNLPSPRDWCYVYNFEEENMPMAISLDTQTALDFKEDMEQLVKKLFKEVPVFFNAESYEKEKNNIIAKYEKETRHISENLNDKAEAMGFIIEENPSEGFIFIPMKDGKEMDAEMYSELSEEEKDHINEKANELRLISLEGMKQNKVVDRQMHEELKNLDNKIANNIIADEISRLKNGYGTSEEMVKYLDLLKEDVIKNIGAFFEIEETEEKKNVEIDKTFFRRYEVKVVVSNEVEAGAPVIYEDSPEYDNLMGKIEYENKMGNLITDFTMIRPGSLQCANGGYLIINAQQLLSNPSSWEALKRCMKAEHIILENSKTNMEIFPILTLKPKNIPLKVKIILIGSDHIYSLLSEHDSDFAKLFKIKAEFDSEIENEEKNIVDLLGFISNYCSKNKLLHITRNGVIELLRYSTRLTESRNYFTASMSHLQKIIDLAYYFASKDKETLIHQKHIKKGILEQQEMHGLTRKKILEMYKNEKYVIELSGGRIGQINGLSVLDYGDCVIGQQHRITVATFAGRKGIIDIERETDMSGSIHDKGIMTLSGYIGEFIGRDVALSFNASISFEQLYSGIEGDSASAAELIALISSLADFPIRQSLAITGSVNQKGQIQPIGGVNSKIEGYFDICSIFGLDGTHGVVIPQTNVDDLILNDKVLDAVEKGLFHIYAVETIEQCIDILCEEHFKAEFKEPIMDGIKQRIVEKLRKYNELLFQQRAKEPR